ncbi:MAG: class I SAM-dependent methyltransferase [bacterium]
MTCILCGSERQTPYCSKPPYEVVRCSGCGFVFATPLPTPAELEAFYDANGRAGPFVPKRSAARRRRFRALLRWVEGFHPPGELLDMGCSQGELLQAAKEADGWEAVGIDLSSPHLDYAASQGLSVARGTLEQQSYPEGRFDVVTASSILEHLRDPVASLREIGRILKPGGIVALVMPCLTHPTARLAGGGWHHINPPNHLWYFSPQTLAALLQKAGLRPRQIRCRLLKAELRAIAEKPA